MSGIKDKIREALDAYERKDFVNALDMFEALSDKSDEASYYLANLYRMGLGTEKNYAKAKQLYENAIKKGNADAKAGLALMYVTGQGVNRDVQLGHKMLEDARYEGSIVAIENLGMMYESGIGVPKDLEKALKYYRSAEELGSESSTYNLGRIYYFGAGVEKNINLAYELLMKSKKKAESAYLLAMMNLKGEVGEKDTAKAYELLNYASDSGCSAAMVQFGLMLINGISCKKDELRGKKLIEKAAKKGNNKAKELLGIQ